MPAQQNKILDQIAIKLNGSDLPHELMDVLLDVQVDTALYLPDMFVMVFHDDELRWMDEDFFRLGAEVEIELAMDEDRTASVVKGEITAIEPHFSPNQSATLVVRGYDRIHRLNRGTKSRVFVQMNDNDIVKRIATEAGLRVRAGAPTEVYSHVFQHNQTDLEFLQARADRLGFELFVENGVLYFRPPRENGSQPLELDWGSTLRSFAPRLTVSGQVSEVVVKGWDPLTKKEIVGKAASSDTAPEINVGGQGGQVASRAFSASQQYIVRQPVSSQSEADRMAQAVLDEINAGFVEAEGVALGNPQLAAGKLVRLGSLGSRFSGTYMLTSAVHLYSARGGYEVRFRVEGARPTMMADLVRQASPASADSLWGGVVPAVVTNINDERNMGRVKLKFPWLDQSLESDWARVVSVGAGKDRGVFWLPEVDDEVLVAFEHGDFNHPYVVGGLWNGEDKPPETTSKAVKNNKLQIRTLKTRKGHIIRFSDDDSDPFIELLSQGGHKVRLSDKDKVIEIADGGSGTTIKLDGNGKNLSIDSKNSVEIKATGNISIEATGQLTLKGAMVNIN